MQTKNINLKPVYQVFALFCAIVIITSTANAIDRDQAAQVLGKVAESARRDDVRSAYNEAKRVVEKGGTLGAGAKHILRTDLPGFKKLNKSVADAIELVLGGKAPVATAVTRTQQVSRTASNASADGGIDALNVDAPKAFAITSLIRDRAISTIKTQVDREGVAGGIKLSGNGEQDQQVKDTATLIEAAKAAVTVLEGGEVLGDTAAMAAVLTFSAKRAESDAKTIKEPLYAQAARQVAAAYRVGAAALAGVLTVTDASAKLQAKPIPTLPVQVVPPPIVPSAPAPATPTPAPQATPTPPPPPVKKTPPAPANPAPAGAVKTAIVA